MIKRILILILLISLIGGGVGFWFWLKGNGVDDKTIVGENKKTNVEVVKEQPVSDPFANDKDRDGILDEKEKEMGLSNKTFDTDKDGLSDLAEIDIFKTDPITKDTDGDGFNDGSEVMNGYNPAGSGKLDTTKLSQ